MRWHADNHGFVTGAERFFWKVTSYPKTILIICIFSIFSVAAFLPKIKKDTSSESFMPDDHPAVVYRESVKEIFGLADPVVVAVVNDASNGIFNPDSLHLVKWLTDSITDIDGVDPERITSLITKNNIVGSIDGILVEPFFVGPPENQEDADKVRQAVMDFPLYLESLVSSNGTATIIIVELLDETVGATVYSEVLKLAKNAPVNGDKIYVAGEAAVVEYLGRYIDADMKKLNPIIGVIVAIILFFAYQTLLGALLPHLVLIGTVVIGVGSMAGFGVPFYIITGALPVILIAISVADCIHVLGEYYENIAKSPNIGKRELVVKAMSKMWRPITITSFSDVAGFMGLSFASFMPPMKAFGIFASIGVIVALLISLFGVPTGFMLFSARPSKAFRQNNSELTIRGIDRFGSIMCKFGILASDKSGYVLAVTGGIVILGVIGALKVEVNEARIANFKHSEAIRKADTVINNLFDGTNYMDIVVETPETEGLFNPERLKRIEGLQSYLETLPHVGGTTSIVDYLKQINKSVNEGNSEFFCLPDRSDLVAQYFLLYSMSGNSEDLESVIDYDYRLANIRVAMNTGLYSDVKVVVEAVQEYIDKSFNTVGITATITGRQNVNYNWIEQIGKSHFRGVIIAFFAVWIMTSLSFRSVVAGFMAMIPVSMAVLLIYAVMGFADIWLGVGTSMFAAIAIGLGVDFAVHVLDRLIVVVRHEGKTLDNALDILFPSTGRSLFFSFLAIFLGFAVLTLSQALPIIRFGILVMIAVLVSFVTSVTVLPAMIKVIRPRFLGFR